jgi:hypothetical protein
MANRYWVGGTAAWDGTAGTKWSSVSGGAGGDSVPTSADDVFFDGSSTGTCTISAGNTGAKSITCTGFTGGLTVSAAITLSGSLTLVSGMTYSATARITFNATATITTAGKTMHAFTVNGAGITVGLGDAYTFSTANASINITQGTFNTNNFNITGTSTNSNNIINMSGSTTRTVNLGSSTLTFACNGASDIWTAITTTNLTFNAGTSSLVFTGTGTFQGGNLTYYNLTFSNNVTRTLNGANTFNTLTLSGTTNITASNTVTTLANGASPATFNFTAGTTTTVTNWNVSGTAGNLVTIQSATAASHTLSKASGSVNAYYLSISRSTATGGATWNAINSVDNGNNTGWIFSTAILRTNFLIMF